MTPSHKYSYRIFEMLERFLVVFLLLRKEVTWMLMLEKQEKKEFVEPELIKCEETLDEVTTLITDNYFVGD